MGVAYQAIFSENGRCETITGSSLGKYYKLDGGITCCLIATPAWCWECSRIRFAEKIASVDEIENDICNVKRLATEIRIEAIFEKRFDRNNPPDVIQQKELEELRHRLQWRLTRRGPPRCLTCGSQRLVIFECGKEVPNPQGQGTILIQVTGFVDMREDDSGFYSSEGERLSLTGGSPTIP